MRSSKVRSLVLIGVLTCLFFAGSANAQQSRIPNYDTARDAYFWTMFYVFGGETVYCAVEFGPQMSVNIAGQRMTVEHAYPADWIAEAFGCDNRSACPDPGYGFAEADLHNLWPALSSINSSRADLAFGTIDPDERRFEDFCPDYERTSGDLAVVEPRDDVKGDLARSILYMAYAYSLPLHGLDQLMLDWHRMDPPDETERWRNYVIERLQGNRNPFIDGLLLW
jgi:deoxyribonuclease-1